MNVDYNWLEEVFFKQKLDDAQRKALDGKFDVVAYQDGDVIVQQGSMGQALYIIHSGEALIECDCNGEHVRVGLVKAGDLIGEMSFLTAAEASATVSAKGDCVVYKLPRSSFTELMKENQELAYAVFAHILTHTADVIRQMNAEKAAIQHYMAGNHF